MQNTSSWTALKPTPSSRSLLALFCIIGSVLIITGARKSPSANPASRFATMDSLVHEGTFVIDHSPLSRYSGDKVKIDGHFISSKPPMLSMAGTAVYWLYYNWTGHNFRDGSRDDTIRFLTGFFNLITFITLLIYFYRFLLLWARSERDLVLLLTSLAFASLILGYSTTLNNHTPAAAAILISLYYAVALRRYASRRLMHWLLAGFAAGLAPSLDLSTSVFSASIFFYLLLFDWKRTLKFFVLASLVPLSAHLFFTYLASGSVIPIYMRKSLYHYPGSYWNNPRGLDALDEPKYIYAFQMFLGHHGFFTMTPVLFLALAGLIGILRKKTEHFIEALFFGGASLIIMVVYIIRTHNYGGTCIGFRWLIPTTPIFMLFAADWLSASAAKWRPRLFIALSIVGVYFAFQAMRSPWRFSTWHNLMIKWGVGTL